MSILSETTNNNNRISKLLIIKPIFLINSKNPIYFRILFHIPFLLGMPFIPYPLWFPLQCHGLLINLIMFCSNSVIKEPDTHPIPKLTRWLVRLGDPMPLNSLRFDDSIRVKKPKLDLRNLDLGEHLGAFYPIGT